MHLHVVDELTTPPGLGEGDGDDDEPTLVVKVGIMSDTDFVEITKGIAEADATPDQIAEALLMTVRGAVSAYSPDVQLAVDRQLLAWKDAR